MLTLYRWLLFVLPGWFREEFGREMVADFRDLLADARRDGLSSILQLVARTLADVLRLGLRLHGDAARQDLTYALRSLRRTPAFTIAVVATLAFALGPVVVATSFVHRVIVAPLPFPQSDRLVTVWNARPDGDARRLPLSVPDYLDYRERQAAFAALAGHTETSVAMVIGDRPRQLSGVLTSADLHGVLGVHPALGRGLSDADSAPGAAPVIVLGAALWRADFGGRTGVLGEAVLVDGAPTTIVGVLPDTLDWPAGSSNAWLPLPFDPSVFSRGSRFLSATGRLADGVSPAQAEDELDGIALALSREYPEINAPVAARVASLRTHLNGDAPRLLAVVSGAIAIVLLVAILNVASLLAIRTSMRRDELAVRAALGATARRVRRQLLMEHAVLATAGGVFGALLGVALHRGVVFQQVLDLPVTADALTGPAFAVLALLVAGIGALFAWVAWVASRHSSPRPAFAALSSSRRSTSDRRVLRMRQVLVAGEVAAALVLLVMGGLMLQSAFRLAAVDLGFRTEGLMTFGVVLPAQTYRDGPDRLRFADRVVDELQHLPGVRRVAVGGYAPMGPMQVRRRFTPVDRTPSPGSEPTAIEVPVGPGYFEVLGIRLVEGRTFSARDDAEAPPVMVVSEQLAAAMFPGQRAVGQQIRFYSGRPGSAPPPPREIVGVVRDVRQDDVAEPPVPQIYTPYAQNPWMFVSFFLAVDGDPSALAPAVERAVTRIDPQRPARNVAPLATLVRESTGRQRTLTWLLGGLAVLALVLAGLGLYGVSATAASARARELAIRAALGADRPALRRLVVAQSVKAGLIGLTLGAAASLAAADGLGALLFEVPPRDPVTLAAMALLLLAVTVIASYLPARRVLAASPAIMLRAD